MSPADSQGLRPHILSRFFYPYPPTFKLLLLLLLYSTRGSLLTCCVARTCVRAWGNLISKTFQEEKKDKTFSLIVFVCSLHQLHGVDSLRCWRAAQNGGSAERQTWGRVRQGDKDCLGGVVTFGVLVPDHSSAQLMALYLALRAEWDNGNASGSVPTRGSAVSLQVVILSNFGEQNPLFLLSELK